MMSLGRMCRARVLDLGCGFGWHALLMSLIGGNEVVANDVRPLMTRAIEKRLDAVEAEFGARPNVQTLCGDFMLVDIPDNAFDAIFSNQTIEHVHNLDACFQKAHSILRPGGRLVVVNDNNCLVRGHLEEIQQMWAQRDSSWDYIERLKHERPEENRDIKPYAVMREEIVRREFPGLSGEAVQKLVSATAGQVESQIVQSGHRFCKDGTVPQRPRHSWCRNPLTGEYCERQFDPFDVKERLRRAGFRARLLQDFRRGGLLTVLTRIDVPPLNRVLFRRRARFVITGLRQQE